MSNTPSRRDGMILVIENKTRFQCARFLMRLGIFLNIEVDVSAAAVTFCHRFFLRESYAKHTPRVIATACYWLAYKDREPRKELTLFQLVEKVISMKNTDLALRMMLQIPFNYEVERDKVLDAEHLVLRTLNFEVGFTLPYDVMQQFTRRLRDEHPEVEDPFHEALANVNFGYFTCLCMRFNAKEIAAGALSNAAEKMRINLPNNWYQSLDVTPDRLGVICREMTQEKQWLTTNRNANFDRYVCCENWVDS